MFIISSDNYHLSFPADIPARVCGRALREPRFVVYLRLSGRHEWQKDGRHMT